jgi:signal transduction histidine kinase
MRGAVRGRLLWKLLAIQAVLVVALLSVLWVALDVLATDTFMTLMKKYDVDAAEVESMFRMSTRNTLIEVGIAGLAAAFALSYWLTRRILRPLEDLAQGTSRIADGDYARLPARGKSRDELDALVSDFNKMAESLERMETSRKTMVVDVAHELRTPLTNLRGTIEALQDGLLRPDAATLDILHDELLRLVRLTEDLLHATRTGAKRRPPTRSPVALGPLLQSTIAPFQARLQRRELRVDLVGHDVEPSQIKGDSDQLKQVFGNLLDNAMQFSPSGSAIKISVLRKNDNVRVLFKNAGDPIPAEDLPMIFEPYYRVDKSRTRRDGTGGAGVGLAIVQAVIEAHGGSVGASSADDATRVWVDLPIAS